MHIFRKTFFVVLCATFSAPVLADELVAVVEQNFPYEEVDESYGTAKVQEGQCQEGTPFPILQHGFEASAKIDVAKRIHEKIRSLGANAFSMIEVEKDAHTRSLLVTPLTCSLN